MVNIANSKNEMEFDKIIEDTPSLIATTMLWSFHPPLEDKEGANHTPQWQDALHSGCQHRKVHHIPPPPQPWKTRKYAGRLPQMVTRSWHMEEKYFQEDSQFLGNSLSRNAVNIIWVPHINKQRKSCTQKPAQYEFLYEI